jgi:hypothetical protein
VSEIRCIECGAAVAVSARSCPTCGDPLTAERRALYEQGALGAIAAGGERPVDTPVRVVTDDAEAGALPREPITLVPDPFIGPITRRTVRYVVARAAISVRRGIIAKRTTTVETYRIGSAGSDVVVTEGPLQRLRGTGTIRIRVPGDPDTPELVLADVHDPHALRSRILAAARLEQISRNRFQSSIVG